MTSERTVLISINSSWNIFHFRGSLLKKLRSEGYALVSAAPADPFTPRLTSLVDRHIDLPMESDGTDPVRDAGLMLRYFRLIKAVKPSVMLTYTIKPNIYGTLAARCWGVPVIANVSGLGTIFIRENWVTHIAKTLYRTAFKQVAFVFFQNAEDRDLFLALRLVKPEKSGVLNGSGIDLDHFKPSDTPREAGKPFSFVLIARLLWDKGIGEYVAAARIVKALHPDVNFSLVGPKGSRNKTVIDDTQIAQWEAEGIIHYLGESEDVRPIMAQHDCIVLPSYREGLSRVLLEAAAMGKPLVATDVPGCRQVVEHGVNGLLCAPQDAQSLADQMLRLLDLPASARDAMGKASRAKAEEKFDQRHIFDAYLEKIRSLSRC